MQSAGGIWYTIHAAEFPRERMFHRRMGEKKGLFARLFSGLSKTRGNLTEKVDEIARDDRKIDEDFYEELEDALLLADCGVKATTVIMDELRERVKLQNMKYASQAREALMDIITEQMDIPRPPLKWPMVMLMVGVNGVGKTTTIGKLALRFQSIGRKVMLCAADTFRAAAADQLTIWAERARVPIVKHAEGADPAAVVFDAISSAKAKGTDVILVDTAGRLHNKKNLMEELKKICRVVDRELPNADFRKYIVLDATTGQNAVNQASVFGEDIDVDGIVLTKLDGTAKGGVVIAIAEELELPVLFVGVGEKIDDLIEFDAQDFIDVLLDD